MAAIPYNVAEAFLAQRRKTRGTFRSTGHDLASYDLRIAYWSEADYRVPELVIAVDLDAAERLTSTTARHVRAFRFVLDRSDVIARIEPDPFALADARRSIEEWRPEDRRN